LNKNIEKLPQIIWGLELDEKEKIFIEFQKNDFLVEKEKIMNKNPCRFRYKKAKSKINNCS